MSPLRIVVVTRDQAAHVKAAWDELEPFLAHHRSEVEIEAIDHGEGVDFQTVSPELVLVLGGDGAILRACRQMGGRQFPIIGVNLGRLGFLADLSPAEFREHFPQIARRDYRIVEHLMYECILRRTTAPEQRYLGLNEVAIVAGPAFKMIDIALHIDGEPATVYSGDGLIVSTPVGSTAHSLSAGGPILRQDLQAFLITPLSPHTITVRPVVDTADRVYTLTLPQLHPGTTLLIDGQIQIPLEAGDQIEIRRAPVSFRLAKVAGHSYYGMLHRKLGWDGQPRYQRGPA